jgi:hypothetical protein
MQQYRHVGMLFLRQYVVPYTLLKILCLLSTIVINVTPGVFMAVTTKITIFWDCILKMERAVSS